MAASKQKDEKFSDEELEEIMDMQAKRQISMMQLREVVRENPVLMLGLVFAFGLLLGVSLRSGRRKSE